MATFQVGNYAFQWTSLHLTSQEMEPLRQKYDELGNATVIRLQELASQIPNEEKEQGNPPPPPPAQRCPASDLYANLRAHHPHDAVLSEFWNQAHTVPDWVDWEQIQRGQKFFYRYALANIMGFVLQGFMGENTAAPGVCEVLVRTGGFSTRKLLMRLLETFQFLLQVTESLEAIQPGGSGHTTAIRVRMLHASVRARIHKLIQTRPDYFDTAKFGEPINILDSIHSISTFCCNHTWLQLPFLGVQPSLQESADYIALFRYVGYLVGTPDEHFQTIEHAKATMESMLLYETRISPTCLIVGHNFVQCITDLPPFNVSAQFVEAGSRVFNGDSFCDSLGHGTPGWYSYLCFRGFCWLVRTLAFAQHLSPAVDRAVTDYFRRTLHENVIHSRAGLCGGSKLEFRNIPQIGKKIGREDSGRLSPGSSFTKRPVEAFFFSVFVLGCLFLFSVLACALYLFHVSYKAFGLNVGDWL